MNKEGLEVYPRLGCVNPAFSITLRLRMLRGAEMVGHIGGSISVDGVVVADIIDAGVATPGDVGPFMAAGLAGVANGPTQMTVFTLVAGLSHAALDHIESARRKNTPGDVNLKFAFDVRWVTMTAAALRVKSIPLPSSGDRVVAIAQEPEAAPIALERGGSFVTSSQTVLAEPFRITGSDWTHVYAPAFGIGRFIVIELPEPSRALNDQKLLSEWDEAIKSARQARDLILRGDDAEAMEALRKPIELVRTKLPDLQDMLQRDGYTPEGATAFVAMIQSQFTLFSKFHHRTDLGRKMSPEIKPQREDTLHAYSSTMTALNMLARKAARLS